jgi:parallel beta-helix repeat protein
MRVKIDADKIIAVLIAIGFLSVTVVLPMVMTRDKVKTYDILSDKDFKKYKFAGEGTEDNPYLIENLNAVDGKKRAVRIRNTNSYFIIRNNFFAYNSFNGISIESIASGTGKIYNNTIIGHSLEGINIESSDFVEVYNNTCLDNKFGVGIYFSNNCSVENNQLIRSQPIIEKDPAYYSGLVVERSNFTTIIDNYIKNTATGIEIIYSNNCNIVNNYITRIFNIGLLLQSSFDCSIEDTVSEKTTFDGFTIRDSYNNIIRNSIARENLNGIVVYNSSYNQLSANSISENAVGIRISQNSLSNIIKLNEILNNTNEGIRIISGSLNIIHHNSFYYNNEGEISRNS